jgi:poly(A) polymerase Pap1
MTTPLSTAGPSDEDKRLNDELLQTLRYALPPLAGRNSHWKLRQTKPPKCHNHFLTILSRSCGLYESDEQLARRENVLKRLHQVLQEYALHEGLARFSESEAAAKQVQLRTFGSYRLGVQSQEADIDT